MATQFSGTSGYSKGLVMAISVFLFPKLMYFLWECIEGTKVAFFHWSVRPAAISHPCAQAICNMLELWCIPLFSLSSYISKMNKHFSNNFQLSVSLYNSPYLCKNFKVYLFIVVLQDTLIYFFFTHVLFLCNLSFCPLFWNAMLCYHHVSILPSHSHPTITFPSCPHFGMRSPLPSAQLCHHHCLASDIIYLYIVMSVYRN